MAQKPDPKTVSVFSRDCTHVIHELGLEIAGGQSTEIPAQHLSRVLQLPGVVQLTPNPALPSED